MVVVRVRNLKELRFSEFVTLNRLALSIDQIAERSFRCIAKKLTNTVLDKTYVSEDFNQACGNFCHGFDTLFQFNQLPNGCNVPATYTCIVYDHENFKFVGLEAVERPPNETFMELTYGEEDDK